jgi:hypothetical protein
MKYLLVVATAVGIAVAAWWTMYAMIFANAD